MKLSSPFYRAALFGLGMLLLGSAAWAQGAASQAGSTPAMPPGAPEMLLNLITSWLLPVVVIPFILQHHWTQTTKRIWSGVICFAVALIATLLNQQYSFRLIEGGTFLDQLANFGSWFLFNATVILSVTKVLFTNFWRDTGLPDRIEAATSAKPTKVQEVNKKIDKVQSLLNAFDALSYLKNTTPDSVPGVLPTPQPAPQSNIIPPAPPLLEPFPETSDDDEAQQLFATILSPTPVQGGGV